MQNYHSGKQFGLRTFVEQHTIEEDEFMKAPQRWYLTVAGAVCFVTAQLTAQVVPNQFSTPVRVEQAIQLEITEGLVRSAHHQLMTLRSRISMSSADEALPFRRTETYRASGNPIAADREMELFAQNRPNSPSVALSYVERGLAAVEAGNTEKSIDLLGAGARLAEDEIPRRNDPWYRELAHMARFWQGVSRARTGMYVEALNSFNLCVEIDSTGPYASRAHYAIGQTYERNGEIKNAIKAFAQIRKNHPKGPMVVAARIREAQNELRIRNPERAVDVLVGIDEILDSLEVGDTSLVAEQQEATYAVEEVLLVRSTAMLMRGRYDLGADSCTLFLKSYPQSPYRHLVHLNRGYSLLHLHRSVESLEDFSVIIDELLDESSNIRQQALLYRALALKRSGRLKEANHAFLDLGARSDYPYRAQALLEVGQVAYEQHRFVDARKALERAVRTSDDASTTIRSELLLGATFIEMQEWQLAAKAYAEAKKLSENATLLYVPNKQKYLAEARLKRGICLVQANDRRNSITALTDFLGNHPDDPQRDEATFWLGEAMYRADLLKNAEELYLEIISTHTASSRREESMYGLAWTYFRQRKFSKATKQFGDLLTAFPKSVFALDALVRMGDAYYINKQYTEAARKYEEAARRGSSTSTGLYAAYQTGQALYNANQFDEASTRLRAFVARNSSSRLADDALYLVGWIEFQRGRDAAAITEFNRILETYPDGDHAARAQYTIADAKYNLGDMEGAIEAYKRVVLRYPNDPLAAESAKSMQQVLMGLDRTEEALAITDTLINANPNSQLAEEFAFKKAEIFYSGKNYQNAAAELEDYIKKFPGSERNDEAIYLLGRSYLTMDDVPQAVNAIRDLETNHPNSQFIAAAKLELASYFDQHANARAADSLYAIVMRDYSSDTLHASQAGFERATVSRMMGDTIGSLNLYRQTANTYPGTEYGDQARYQLALYYRKTNNVDSARHELAILARTAGRPLIAANALYDIGDTYARRREWEKAIPAFVRVREEFSGYEDWYTLALIGLGACYEQLDELEKAQEVYGVVSELRPDDDYGRTAKARLDRIERKK